MVEKRQAKDGPEQERSDYASKPFVAGNAEARPGVQPIRKADGKKGEDAKQNGANSCGAQERSEAHDYSTDGEAREIKDCEAA